MPRLERRTLFQYLVTDPIMEEVRSLGRRNGWWLCGVCQKMHSPLVKKYEMADCLACSMGRDVLEDMAKMEKPEPPEWMPPVPEDEWSPDQFIEAETATFLNVSVKGQKLAQFRCPRCGEILNGYGVTKIFEQKEFRGKKSHVVYARCSCGTTVKYTLK